MLQFAIVLLFASFVLSLARLALVARDHVSRFFVHERAADAP